jgi:hypothetical protein
VWEVVQAPVCVESHITHVYGGSHNRILSSLSNDLRSNRKSTTVELRFAGSAPRSWSAIAVPWQDQEKTTEKVFDVIFIHFFTLIVRHNFGATLLRVRARCEGGVVWWARSNLQQVCHTSAHYTSCSGCWGLAHRGLTPDTCIDCAHPWPRRDGRHIFSCKRIINPISTLARTHTHKLHRPSPQPPCLVCCAG